MTVYTLCCDFLNIFDVFLYLKQKINKISRVFSIIFVFNNTLNNKMKFFRRKIKWNWLRLDIYGSRRIPLQENENRQKNKFKKNCNPHSAYLCLKYQNFIIIKTYQFFLSSFLKCIILIKITSNPSISTPCLTSSRISIIRSNKIRLTTNPILSWWKVRTNILSTCFNNKRSTKLVLQ